MLIFKIIGIAFVGVLCVAALREVKPSLAITAGVATGVAVIMLLIGELTTVTTTFESVSESSGLDSTLIKTVIKIIGIGYLTEFSANVCEDYGSRSIAQKVQLGGKICILILALPLINGIVKTIASIAR